MRSFAGQRVTVMGLGRFGGGVGVTRFLAQRGAVVRVTDQLRADQLGPSLAPLADLHAGGLVSYRLGGHDEADFTGADLVVANPAVKPGDRYLAAAAAAGVPITSEVRLLVAHLPDRGRVIGITGSSGKSTVTAMLGHLLRRAGRPAHLGGNLGGSLLPHLERIGPGDWVVLELSSFMLDGLARDRWSPRIAALTNLAPNHLDWHGSFEAYRAAKEAIFAHQRPGDIAIREPAPPPAHGAAPGGGRFDLAVPGAHNQLNAGFAFALARAAGLADAELPPDALADFPGLAHRLELVAHHAGVDFVNDSKSTTPEAARLAIQSFAPGRVHLIAGGYDKGLDLTGLARLAGKRCAGLYTLGDTGAAIADAALDAAPDPAKVLRCGELEAAVRRATGRARSGQVVLLSPGCASWDQFENFESRGRAFTEAVLRCTTETGAHIR